MIALTEPPLLANPPLHVLVANRRELVQNFEAAWRYMEAHYERSLHNHIGNPATHVVIPFEVLQSLVEFRRGARSGWRH